jgi:hypothetical protein
LNNKIIIGNNNSGAGLTSSQLNNLNSLNPSNGNFNPSNIVLNNHETYFNDFAQNGSLNILTPINNYGNGACFQVNIITDGSPITIFSGANIRILQF